MISTLPFFLYPTLETLIFSPKISSIKIYLVAIVIVTPNSEARQLCRSKVITNKYSHPQLTHPNPKPNSQYDRIEHTSLSNLEKNMKPDIALLGAFGSFLFFCFLFFPSSSSFDFFLEVDALEGRSFFDSFLAGFWKLVTIKVSDTP